MESTQCEKDFPKHCQVSEFEKLLVVQSLRPDKLLTCIENSCLRISGESFIVTIQFKALRKRKWEIGVDKIID